MRRWIAMARRRLGVLAVVATAGLLVGAVVGTVGATSAVPATLTVTLGGIRPGGVIPNRFAFCVPANPGRQAIGPNINPAIRWSAGPAGTAAYAVLMHDTDVPVTFELANKEGTVLPATAARRSAYYHWVLVDIPARVRSLSEGVDSSGPQPKPAGPTPHGVRGANDFGEGRSGYDGPCPPWNDAIPHHYHFTVYAIDVSSLGLSGAFSGPDAVRAMTGHVLAAGAVTGVYTLNPDVSRTLPRQ
jgi:Raf kinase inhibitor-like YbhB/YbcL family protein